MRPIVRAIIASMILSLTLFFAAKPTWAQEPTAQTQSQDALQVIEGVRGGRHWIDEETDPAKSPTESMECLQVEPGVELQLFAAEPLVFDPVAITFDQHGRMFVVEYGDYPIGPPDGGDPLSRIVYLEDKDNDGRADARHVFADKLHFAHSLMPYRDGLLVGAHTKILFLKDTDGDHVADVREVLFDGFKPAHPQMQIGNPRWGIDNWVYLNYGPGTVTSSAAPDKPVEMPRKEFRFHPETMEFEAGSGLGQFGNTIDRWGNRFYCTNRNPIMMTVLSPAVLKRNPFITISPAHVDVAKSGGDSRVYPLVAMKSNYLSHAGTHTSACGTTAYTGDLFSGDFQDSVFVCEPIGHLVTRSIVEPDGVILKARRARPKADFIASTDTWFRPASLANGPDGALYLADMYRLWVEHPKFLPPEIGERLDWRAGEDRGRIYRIVPKGAKTREFVTPTNVQETAQLLEDANGWRQFLGQRLLVEQNEETATSILRETLHSERPTARLHALWTLEGLGVLQRDDILNALADSHPIVRRDAVRLSTRYSDDESVQLRLDDALDDDDVGVRFQLALASGEKPSKSSTIRLAALALSDGDDRWFANGLLTSTKEQSGAILQFLLSDPSFVASGSAARIDLVKRLASIVGTRGDLDEMSSVLAALGNGNETGLWWQAAAISGLGQGLPRHRGDLGRTSLAVLLKKPPESLKATIETLSNLLTKNQQAALDRSRPATDRAAAVELLAYQPFAEASPAFEELLSNDQPVEVQTACIDALSSNGSAAAADIVLERWPELGPAVRGSALNLLLRRVESTKKTLDAMAAGKMRPAALSIDQRVRLLKHSDEALRKQAIELFGGAVSSNRRAVAEQYQKALTLTASAAEGVKVFTKICANCHKIDGKGHDAGPDLSDVRNRSKLALLYDILDPNSKVEPRFTAYSVLTLDGNIFNGLIASETSEAVVLKMAEGKQKTIGRGEIDQIQVSNVSLMPEGVEKDISPQQMADLLEYLKTRT